MNIAARKAISIPNITLNWNRAVILPRMKAGDTSDMYIGATTDDAPTAIPPRKRETVLKECRS